jgi:hypothetical protein
MTPKSRLLIVDAVLPAQTEAGGDMAGYLIDVSESRLEALNKECRASFWNYHVS